MARIRTIKPEFPHSESMGRVSRDARLTFIQMWTLADDAGRLRGNSRMLASLLFPYDDDAPSLIEEWMSALEQEGCIVRYIADGTSCVQICNWLTHQKIDKPSPSKLPQFDESSRIVAKSREPSSVDQGSGPGSRIKEGTKDQGKASPSSAAPTDRADVQTVFEHWQREWNHQDANLDDKRRKRIEARLKNFPAAKLCEAISGFKHSPWHCGTDPSGDGKVYDKLETLLRDSSQVEEGIRLFTHPPRPPPKVVQLGPVERVLAAARKANGDERVVSEQSDGGVGNPVGNLRQPVSQGVRRIASNTVGERDWDAEGFRDYERVAAPE